MLTKKQLDLLDFINKRIQRDGVSPSFDEMKEALDLRSKSGIHRLITALEERGFIRRLAHRARALEIVKLPESLGGAPSTGFTPRVIEGDAAPRPAAAQDIEAIHAMELPMMGKIAAGQPIEAMENPTPIAVPGAMIRSGAEHYALEVDGDSMIEAGINDGDVVVIRETNVAQAGDIVVALVDGQNATLKTFRRQGDAIALEPANARLQTQVYPAERVKIQGKLVGLIRSY
ncbi:transcriptional repressor LexA [Roseobacteraceae bacterium S113]